MNQRDVRQQRMAKWIEDTFGPGFNDTPERATRFLEEALELVQACGLSHAAINRVVEHVYSRPAGDVGQEIGGVSVCLLALSQTLNLSADIEEEAELNRIEAKTPEYFRERHNAKAAAGIAAPSRL